MRPSFIVTLLTAFTTFVHSIPIPDATSSNNSTFSLEPSKPPPDEPKPHSDKNSVSVDLIVGLSIVGTAALSAAGLALYFRYQYQKNRGIQESAEEAQKTLEVKAMMGEDSIYLNDIKDLKVRTESLLRLNDRKLITWEVFMERAGELEDHYTEASNLAEERATFDWNRGQRPRAPFDPSASKLPEDKDVDIPNDVPYQGSPNSLPEYTDPPVNTRAEDIDKWMMEDEQVVSFMQSYQEWMEFARFQGNQAGVEELGRKIAESRQKFRQNFELNYESIKAQKTAEAAKKNAKGDLDLKPVDQEVDVLNPDVAKLEQEVDADFGKAAGDGGKAAEDLAKILDKDLKDFKIPKSR